MARRAGRKTSTTSREPIGATTASAPVPFDLTGSMLLVGLTLLVLWPVCGHEFLDWDDLQTIATNPSFNSPSLESVAVYWRRPHMSLYVPVTYTAWGIIAAVARGQTPDVQTGSLLNPWIFHTANLLIHAATAVAALDVLRQLVKRRWAAWFGAALLAVHPVQVETVAWASGTKDLLAGFFSLLAIGQYLRFAVNSRGADGLLDRRRVRAYALGTLAFLLAMLSKPSAVSVPLIVACLDWLLLKRRARKIALATGAWLLLALPFILIGSMAQPAHAYYSAPLWARPFIATDAFAFYVGKLLAPIHLAVDYGRSPRWLMGTRLWQLTWLVPAALAALCGLLRREAPWLAASCAVLAAALLPVLGLVKFEFQVYSTVSDHYLYLAMLGPAILAAFLLQRARWKAAWWAAGIVLCLLATRSFAQTFHWADTKTLFTHELAVNPTSLAGQNILGFVAAREGRAEEAIARYEAGLATEPDHAVTHYNLANALMKQGRFDAAAAHYARAVALHPEESDWHSNYGFALLKLDRIEPAIVQFQSAARLNPRSAGARLNLGLVYEMQGDPQSARVHYAEALRIDPNEARAERGLARVEAILTHGR